ncbi:MAG: hypothetical protein K2L59_04045 [Muribaculaceae bacterium]|nr:hypothetical protein [Muribaculaceae bacterium]
MQELFFSDEQIRSVIPNIQKSVVGETPWSDRLSGFLETAVRFCEGYISPMRRMPDNLVSVARRFCVWYAWAEALPSLDLVATPNGFAVVSNQTLAPASQARVEAARANAAFQAGQTACALLDGLRHDQEWRVSREGKRFFSLFPDPRDFTQTCPAGVHPFFHYIARWHQLLVTESEIAVKVLSSKAMHELRIVAMRQASGQEVSGQDLEILGLVRTAALDIIDGLGGHRKAFALIRSALDMADDSRVAALWRMSPLFKAFKSAPYENKKDSGGFFF